MTKESKEAIARQYLAGRYNSDICNEFGISKTELYDVLKELKIPRKILKGSYSKLPVCEYCGEKNTVERRQVLSELWRENINYRKMR